MENNNKTVEQKILEIIQETVRPDTGMWGECGGINRDSQKEAAKEITELWHSTQPVSAPVETGAGVWKYCPECGDEEYVNENLVGKGYRCCKQCGQEWWLDVDYKNVVRENLIRLFNKSKSPPTKAEQAGLSAEEMLGKFNGFSRRSFGLLGGDDKPEYWHKDDVLKAMESYANQFKQQPTGEGNDNEVWDDFINEYDTLNGMEENGWNWNRKILQEQFSLYRRPAPPASNQ